MSRVAPVRLLTGEYQATWRSSGQSHLYRTLQDAALGKGPRLWGLFAASSQLSARTAYRIAAAIG
jgi:hypothetical protein